MTLRHQILLLPALIALLACALMAAGSFLVGTRLDALMLHREMDVAQERLMSEIETTTQEALARARIIAGLPVVQRAVAEGDDAALEALMAGNWAELRDQTGMVQLQFHTPPATSLIRIHNLEKRGDDLSGFRAAVVEANRTGNAIATLERGKAGVGARGIAPVRYQGQHVGTIEVGLDIGQGMLDHLTARTGSDFEYYSLTGSGAEMASERLFVSAESGEEPSATSLLTEAELASVVAGTAVDRRIEIHGEGHFLRAVSLQDFSGEVIGVISMAQPSGDFDMLAALARKMSMASAALAFVISALAAWYFGGRITGQVKRLATTTHAIAGGDLSVTIRGQKRPDELGDMARALQIFRDNLEETGRIQAALRAEEENTRRAEAAQQAEAEQARQTREAARREAEELRRKAEEEERAAMELREQEAQARLAEQERMVHVLGEALGALARSDLAQVIHEELPGKYERLRLDYNEAIAQLARVMADLGENARRLEGEVATISDTADSLSQTTEQNAATLEETAAALNQLTASVQAAAEGAQAARTMASDARGVAETGVGVVETAVSAMAEIEASSQKISRITSVIDDIAFQTNLLALNAGVEAARAGEAGRGFAVVASEVRALAQRSSEAAKDISDLIAASDHQVRQGVDLVGQSGQSLNKIVAAVRAISARIDEIATSSGEQARGIAEINEAVNLLDRATQRTAALFDQAAEASRQMLSENAALVASISQFSLPDDPMAGGQRIAAE
jgi:methyl-accepting chemotaxis protein